MNRCNPAEMRKNLQVVEQFKNAGIDFVPVPVRDEDHKNELIAQVAEILQELIEAANKTNAAEG